jgi:hypothetical protein
MPRQKTSNLSVEEEREARREYQRRYYQAHKEKAKEYQRRYNCKYRKKRKTQELPTAARPALQEVFTIVDISDPEVPPEKMEKRIAAVLQGKRALTK